MSAKRINERCPLQAECERRCQHEGRELECDYYYANARDGHEIEDQEEKRREIWRQRDKEAEEEYLAELEEDEEGLAEGRSIDVITEEILFYKRQAGCAFIEIGRRLVEAKETLSHGEWLPWLKGKVDFSERSAQNFMRLYRELGKSAEIADLGASKALALLALPESERADFAAEKHTVNGEEKTVADMTGAELKQAIRERDEARRALSEEQEASEGALLRIGELESDLIKAREEYSAAAAARDKMAEDMKFLKKQVEGLNEAVALKERELEEERGKPVEVAVQEVADPAAMEQARQEGAAEARQELEKLKEELKAAKEKAKTAKEKLAEAEKKTVAALQETERAHEETQRARKEAEIAADKELAEFMFLFKDAQDTVNRMAGILRSMDEGGKEETAEKLRRALCALSDSVGKAAEKR